MCCLDFIKFQVQYNIVRIIRLLTLIDWKIIDEMIKKLK